MRPDCLSSKPCAALAVAFAALSLAACGSSGNKGGSTVHADGGGGTGNGGTGGVSMGGAGGQSMGGAGGQAAGGTGGQAAGGSSSCSEMGPSAGCKTCLEGKCCSESAACAANADCKAFIQCKESCTPYYDNTTQCAKDCLAKYPNGPGSAYNGLIVCAQTNCKTECTYP